MDTKHAAKSSVKMREEEEETDAKKDSKVEVKPNNTFEGEADTIDPTRPHV